MIFFLVKKVLITKENLLFVYHAYIIEWSNMLCTMYINVHCTVHKKGVKKSIRYSIDGHLESLPSLGNTRRTHPDIQLGRLIMLSNFQKVFTSASLVVDSTLIVRGER